MSKSIKQVTTTAPVRARQMVTRIVDERLARLTESAEDFTGQYEEFDQSGDFLELIAVVRTEFEFDDDEMAEGQAKWMLGLELGRRLGGVR